MTDVGHVTEQMQSYIGEANYLVIEANYDTEMLYGGTYPAHLKSRIDGPTGHLSNKDCGEALANYATANLKHVWLCHLSEENNHPVLALKTIEQTLRSYGLVMGKDFKRLADHLMTKEILSYFDKVREGVFNEQTLNAAAVNATEDLKDDEKDLQRTYIGISDFMKSDYPLESVTSKKAS